MYIPTVYHDLRTVDPVQPLLCFPWRSARNPPRRTGPQKRTWSPSKKGLVGCGSQSASPFGFLIVFCFEGPSRFEERRFIPVRNLEPRSRSHPHGTCRSWERGRGRGQRCRGTAPLPRCPFQRHQSSVFPPRSRSERQTDGAPLPAHRHSPKMLFVLNERRQHIHPCFPVSFRSQCCSTVTPPMYHSPSYSYMASVRSTFRPAS